MHLKIATYNIQFGIKEKKILENIKKLADDGVHIFCLQEVQEVKSSFLLQNILKILGKDWNYESMIRPGSRDLGLMTIWRKNIKNKKSEGLILPKLEKFSLHERIARKLTLNFIKNTLERGALVTTFKIGSKDILVCNLHIDCAGGFKQKFKQLTHLTTRVKFTKATIVCGDFNTIGLAPFTKIQEKKILSILGAGFINVYPRRLPTQRNSYQRLDYVFSKGLKVNSAQIVKMKGSDHFPIVVEFEV